jgi:hypothetical protein
MTLVVCPCCKGEKRLRIAVYDWDQESGELLEGIKIETCTHCMGEGKIEAEVDD